MFNLKKLFGFEPMEEDMPMRIEPQLPKKDVEGAKREVYHQIGGILDENRIDTRYPEDQVYPRLKKSLQRINEAIEANKENLVSNERELKALKEKVLEYKDERNLTFMTYDICKLISRNRYEDPSILSNMTIRRIMNYWYGFY